MDRLQEEFDDAVMFWRLNAADGGQGQAMFERLALPGHPSYVMFHEDGTEAYRGFGVVDEAALREAIQAALGNG